MLGAYCTQRGRLSISNRARAGSNARLVHARCQAAFLAGYVNIAARGPQSRWAGCDEATDEAAAVNGTHPHGIEASRKSLSRGGARRSIRSRRIRGHKQPSELDPRASRDRSVRATFSARGEVARSGPRHARPSATARAARILDLRRSPAADVARRARGGTALHGASAQS